jgi:hypothetical protein
VTEVLEKIAGMIRSRWKHTRIVIRGDSGFYREELMGWRERQGLSSVIGLAGNTRLVRRIKKQLRRACVQHTHTGMPARLFSRFWYRALRSWSRRP